MRVYKRRFRYCVAYDCAEDCTIIKKLDYSKRWAPDNLDGWTYTSEFGAHVMAPIYETSNFADAHKASNYFLKHHKI